MLFVKRWLLDLERTWCSNTDLTVNDIARKDQDHCLLIYCIRSCRLFACKQAKHNCRHWGFLEAKVYTSVKKGRRGSTVWIVLWIWTDKGDPKAGERQRVTAASLPILLQAGLGGWKVPWGQAQLCSYDQYQQPFQSGEGAVISLRWGNYRQLAATECHLARDENSKQVVLTYQRSSLFQS